MFNQKRGFIAGFITCALLCVLVMNVFAAPIEKVITATYNSIKIVVDGKEIKPTDANGNTTEPFIYNGTTYLPVRAVANAFEKAVYWDGSAYTVYLGTMDGKLEYPSLRLEDVVSIGRELTKTKTPIDNYENIYDTAFYYTGWSGYYHTLLNKKYSRFRMIAFIEKGDTTAGIADFRIELDGKIIYISPEIDKTTSPIKIDIDITGGNEFKIICTDVKGNGPYIHFGNAGFYQ